MSKIFSPLQARILKIIRREPNQWWSSFDVLDMCKEEEPELRAGVGNFHPALRGLVSDGFVKHREETEEEQIDRIRTVGRDDRGGRKRQLYKATESGRRVLLKTEEGVEDGCSPLGDLVTN